MIDRIGWLCVCVCFFVSLLNLFGRINTPITIEEMKIKKKASDCDTHYSRVAAKFFFSCPFSFSFACMFIKQCLQKSIPKL